MASVADSSLLYYFQMATVYQWPCTLFHRSKCLQSTAPKLRIGREDGPEETVKIEHMVRLGQNLPCSFYSLQHSFSLRFGQAGFRKPFTRQFTCERNPMLLMKTWLK